MCVSCLPFLRSLLRRYGWSPRNTPVNVTLPFARGKRVSVLAAMDVTSFLLEEILRTRSPEQNSMRVQEGDPPIPESMDTTTVDSGHG